MIRNLVLSVCCVVTCAAALGTAGIARADGRFDFDQWCRELDARPGARESLFFSPLVGQELDADERAGYGLFRNTRDFVSAGLPVDPKGHYRLRVTRGNSIGVFETYRRFDAESLRLTRLHLYLTESFRAQPPFGEGRQAEADLLWRLALRFAARGRYQLVQGVLEDLVDEFPGTDAAVAAARLLPEVRALRNRRQTLVWDEQPQRGSGSNDLKLFGGYYGLWLGIAAPLALDADSAEAYGLGLMLGGPLGYLAASAATRRWDISEGRATMIELGGNLGAWQGMGWADQRGSDAQNVVAVGVLSGLGGIAGAAYLTSRYEFTEGHAALTAAAAPWGAWFGLIASALSESDTDEGWDPHRSMMIGADAAVLAVGVGARGSRMSEKRVRLINLNGVIGTVMALGFTLIAQPDDGNTVLAIAGAGGALGLAAGYRLTARVDPAEHASGEIPNDPIALAERPGFRFPEFSVQPDRLNGRGAMPALGASWSF